MKTTTRTHIVNLAVCVMFSGFTATASAADCRSIEGDAERLACYDSLNSAPSPQPQSPEMLAAPESQSVPVIPAVIVEATSTPVESAPAVLDDSVGKETIEDRNKEDKMLVAGHVDSCREDNSGKYRFYFDNGQIWLQKDNKRVPWRECNFDVTVEKDFFGYKMSPKGESKSIRISRIK